MKDRLVIKEKYSRHWPAVAAVSFILSILFFAAYLLASDVLWIGYLRLASFVFFSSAILSLFKVFDGQVKIILSVHDGSVCSEYRVKNKTVFSVDHPLSDFHKFKIDQLPNKSLYNDFMKSDKCVRFQRKDESAWYYFNEIDSRVIPLNQQNAQMLRDFLKQHSKKSEISSDE